MQLNPYLVFNGNCADAFRFYEQCLEGKLALMTHGNSPMAEQTPPEWRDKVLHARLEVGSTVLMGSDAPPQHFEPQKGFSVSLSLQDVDKAERIFSALAENGTVQMPMQKTFWAARFGMVVDRFGVPWMVNCEQAA